MRLSFLGIQVLLFSTDLHVETCTLVFRCWLLHWATTVAAGRTVSHNLGAVPEMMWVKRRDVSRLDNWFVYNKDLDASNPSHKYIKIK
jgi:hypothetical protein